MVVRVAVGWQRFVIGGKCPSPNITAQDDRVSVVDGTMPLKAGGSYDQTYLWLFTILDDKIVEILEYLDILQVWKAFGTSDQKTVAKGTTEV